MALVRSRCGSGRSIWGGSDRAVDPHLDAGEPVRRPAVDGGDQRQLKVWHIMGMVDGIMGIAANVVMDMAMRIDRFHDGADGVRMRVGRKHRSGEQRRKNHSDDSRKPCEPTLMHGVQSAPAWLTLAEGRMGHLIARPVGGDDGLSMAVGRLPGPRYRTGPASTAYPAWCGTPGCRRVRTAPAQSSRLWAVLATPC